MNIFSPKNVRIIILVVIVIVAIVLIVSGATYTTTILDTQSPEGRYKVDVTGKVIHIVSLGSESRYRVGYTDVDWELQEPEDVDFFPDLGPFWFWETSNVDVKAILQHDDEIVADATQSLGSFSTIISGDKPFDLHMKNIEPSEELFTLYLEIYEGNNLKYRVEHSSWYMLPKVT